MTDHLATQKYKMHTASLAMLLLQPSPAHSLTQAGLAVQVRVYLCMRIRGNHSKAGAGLLARSDGTCSAHKGVMCYGGIYIKVCLQCNVEGSAKG